MNKKIIILDAEWYSWKGNYWGNNLKYELRKKNQFPYLICLGYVKFDYNFNIIEKNKIYFQQIKKLIPSHTKKLTGINEVEIYKKGKNLTYNLSLLRKIFRDCVIFANGTDEKIINRNFKLNNQNKFKIENIKLIFKRKYNIPDNYLSSSNIGSYFGFDNKNPHCPLSDAESIYEVCKILKIDFQKVKSKIF